MDDSEQSRRELADLPTEVVDLLVLRVSQWLTQAEKVDIPIELVPLAGFRPGHRHRDRRVRATLTRTLERDPALATHVGDWLGSEKGPGPDGQDADITALAVAWLGGDAETLSDLLALRTAASNSGPMDSERIVSLEKRIVELQESLASIQLRHKRQSDSRGEKSSRQAQELTDARSQLNRVSQRAGELESQLSSLQRKLTVAATMADKRDSNNRAQIRSLESELEQVRRDRSQDRRSSRYLERLEVARTQVLLSAAQSAIEGLTHEIATGSTASPADLLWSNDAPTNPLMRKPGANQLVDWLVAPGLHLIVDGYNVTKAATPDLPLAQQRELLVGRLRALSARTRAEVTVVFDAQNVNLTMPSSSRKGARVIFTNEGEIADDVIVDLVSVEPPGRAVLVITSDQELSSRVTRLGARAVPSQEFNSALDKG